MNKALIFATNNTHKVNEIRSVLADRFEVVSLKEAGILIDIPEPFDTLEENAREKCSVIYNITGQDCFSEDTGLEVFALHGAPGVRSARYAGEKGDALDNTNKLLREMSGITDRTAQFRTIISLCINGHYHTFEGICRGQIIDKPRGDQGFGYDPVFIPDGASQSFAEMNLAEKNRFSHRKKATEKLINYLKQKNGKG